MDRGLPRDWMWSQACEMLARAERLNRELFRPRGEVAQAPAWEPPLDMLETEREVLVLVALPGVNPAAVEAALDNGNLVVAGTRVLPSALRTAVIVGHDGKLLDANRNRAVPIAVAAISMFAATLGVLLSAVNVYLRDTQHLIEVILTAWFWACPIVYSFQAQIETRLGPKGLTWIYFLNPMVPLVLSFQRCIYAHTVVSVHGVPTQVLPSDGMLWYVGLDLGVLFLSALLFLVALAVFSRLEGNFAEEL